MCCEDCSGYENCDIAGQLKENCCPRCTEYFECVGTDNKEEDSFSYSFEDESQDDYL